MLIFGRDHVCFSGIKAVDQFRSTFITHVVLVSSNDGDDDDDRKSLTEWSCCMKFCDKIPTFAVNYSRAFRRNRG